MSTLPKTLRSTRRKVEGQFTLPFFNAVWNSNTLQLGRSLRSTGPSDSLKAKSMISAFILVLFFQAEIEAPHTPTPTEDLPSLCLPAK